MFVVSSVCVVVCILQWLCGCVQWLRAVLVVRLWHSDHLISVDGVQ